ncbi:MAG TPA: WYL domain-containing protein, partial [Verrucomicrobiae bacterium]|nr:WYL domain-containing protein [Verrucomicrobiae bacterium]
DHLRSAIRTFAPGRVQIIDPTGKTFARPQKFSLEKRLRDSFGVHSGQGEFAVVLRFSELVADYIREKKWHSSQELRELEDGSVELSLKLSSIVEVQRWILGWGGECTVVSPPELGENIRSAAQKILSQPETPSSS